MKEPKRKDLKKRKTLPKKKKGKSLEKFKGLFITEKEKLNISQKNFHFSPQIKLGQR